MPEGDTVYLTAHRLNSALGGRRLRRGELRHPRWATHDLAGRTVLTVRSVGKHLLIRFDDGRSLHNHLRMDGGWHLYTSNDRWRRAAHHARAILATDDRIAVGFRLHDLELLATTDEHRLVGHLGPDLLDPRWSSEHQAEALRRLTADPHTDIGLALLDQRVMAGVGNLYRCEVCFLLGVSPWARVDEVVEPARAVELAHRLLLRNADRPEQSTTGELGRGRQHWVYRRGGLPCRRCGTRIEVGEQGGIERGGVEQGGGELTRTVYFCPRCQPGPRSSPGGDRS